jgi:hypothetical protein
MNKFSKTALSAALATTLAMPVKADIVRTYIDDAFDQCGVVEVKNGVANLTSVDGYLGEQIVKMDQAMEKMSNGDVSDFTKISKEHSNYGTNNSQNGNRGIYQQLDDKIQAGCGVDPENLVAYASRAATALEWYDCQHPGHYEVTDLTGVLSKSNVLETNARREECIDNLAQTYGRPAKGFNGGFINTLQIAGSLIAGIYLPIREGVVLASTTNNGGQKYVRNEDFHNYQIQTILDEIQRVGGVDNIKLEETIPTLDALWHNKHRIIETNEELLDFKRSLDGGRSE